MSEKAECKVPVSEVGSVLAVGNFRLQKDRGHDEFHVHYDEKGLKFVFGGAKLGDTKVGGLRRWDLAWEEFKNSQHSFKEGQIVLFVGKRYKSKTHKSCDLAFKRRDNKWEMQLYLCGTVRADAIIGDTTVTVLDEWMERN